MSLGDLYHKNKISLAGRIRPDRWGRKNHIPDQHVEGWRSDLQQFRFLWEHGESTILETDFFEYFNPEDKPSRWPEWLTK